ncbi:MAG: EamA family transporter [Candidatus Aenigmarchaeota archaeon]|nr:EamA family transporter [Candidatus Aenigmarchaeota archaeon]NIP40123.1 EamA family transporter [Candidatus Aenigmarchaeota archaeon]NIQ18200.1 EamA family transporter [Candidatus Aenigmarchaeota archaeon]NIS72957.1 EamA family transporter [Candidatus Aenigmarchaeota archaeon]
MNKETLGTVLALIAAVISGFAIPVNKIFVVDLDPTVFTAVRAIIIGVIFLGLSILTNRFSLRNIKEMDWRYLLLIAVIGGAFAFLLFFTGLKFTTGGRAAFLHKTLPLYVAIFAFILLREKIPKKQIFALIIMLIGTVVLFSAQINPADLWMNPQLGDALVIGATILWALENVIARKAMIKGETNFVVSFARMFFGGIILFGVVLLLGKFDLLLSLSAQQWFNISISVAILFVYVLFWYWSILHINVSKASSLLLIAPVVSLVVGVLWLGEPAPNLQLMGSALILIGAYFVVGIKSRFSTGV